MTRSTLAALLLAALALPAAPATLAAPPPALAGTVEVTGGTANSTTVRLLKPITPAALTATAGVSATGAATVTTVVLTRAGAGAQPGYVFQRIFFSGREEWTNYSLGDPEAKELLPAGTYKLYLLSDKPTTIKFKIGNQPGSLAKIRATGPAKGRAAAVAVPPLAASQPPLINESHDTYTASKPFAVFGIAGFDLASRHQLSVQSCTYDGDPPANTANCNGGTLGPEDGGGSTAAPTVKQTYVQRTRWMRADAGKKLTYGLYYRTTGVPQAVYRWNVWVELT